MRKTYSWHKLAWVGVAVRRSWCRFLLAPPSSRSTGLSFGTRLQVDRNAPAYNRTVGHPLPPAKSFSPLPPNVGLDVGHLLALVYPFNVGA